MFYIIMPMKECEERYFPIEPPMKRSFLPTTAKDKDEAKPEPEPEQGTFFNRKKATPFF